LKKLQFNLFIVVGALGLLLLLPAPRIAYQPRDILAAQRTRLHGADERLNGARIPQAGVKPHLVKRHARKLARIRGPQLPVDPGDGAVVVRGQRGVGLGDGVAEDVREEGGVDGVRGEDFVNELAARGLGVGVEGDAGVADG